MHAVPKMLSLSAGFSRSSSCQLLDLSTGTTNSPGPSVSTTPSATCLRHDGGPWMCWPGGDISGKGLVAFQTATPEICKWTCDQHAECTHVYYNATSYGCYLRKAPFLGPHGVNALSGEGPGVACVKTTAHRDYGTAPTLPPVPADHREFYRYGGMRMGSNPSAHHKLENAYQL